MFFMVFVNFLEITVFYVRAGLFLMPVLIACSLLMSCPWSWHWPSCLWQEVPRRACLIRRKGSLLGLVTLQRPMVMSPMLSVCKCVLVHTDCTGECCSWCLVCVGGVYVCTHTRVFFCWYMFVCVCIYEGRTTDPPLFYWIESASLTTSTNCSLIEDGVIPLDSDSQNQSL